MSAAGLYNPLTSGVQQARWRAKCHLVLHPLGGAAAALVRAVCSLTGREIDRAIIITSSEQTPRGSRIDPTARGFSRESHLPHYFIYVCSENQRTSHAFIATIYTPILFLSTIKIKSILHEG